MPEATWNGKAWVTEDGQVLSDDPNAGTPLASGTASVESGWTEALPALVGTGASLVAGGKRAPTGMAAAGFGGAVGEMARQKIRQAQGTDPQPSMARRVGEAVLGPVGQMAINPEALSAGVAQAGIEGVGRGIAAPVTAGAKYLYRTALRPAMHLAREYGMDNIVNQGFTNKVWPNRWGVPKAKRLLEEARDDVTAIASDASQPTGVNPRLLPAQSGGQAVAGGPPQLSVVDAMQSAVPGLIDKAKMATRAAGAADATPNIRIRAQRIADANPTGTMTPIEMLKARRATDAVAEPAFDMARRTGGRVELDSDAAFAQAMGKGYNKQLDTALGAPFREANRTAQSRYGLRKSVEDASMRPHELANQMASSLGGGLAGGAAGYAYGGDLNSALTGIVVSRGLMSPTVRTAAAFGAPSVAKHGVRALDVLSGGEATSSLRDSIMAMMEQNTEIP